MTAQDWASEYNVWIAISAPKFRGEGLGRRPYYTVTLRRSGRSLTVTEYSPAPSIQNDRDRWLGDILSFYNFYAQWGSLDDVDPDDDDALRQHQEWRRMVRFLRNKRACDDLQYLVTDDESED